MRNKTSINQETQSIKEGSFFELSPQESETIVFFLNQKYVIENIILKTRQSYFSKLPYFSKKSFTTAISYLNLDKKSVLTLLEQAESALFIQQELSDNNHTCEYMVSVAYTFPSCVVILTVIDRTNEALKAYINTIINTLPGAIYWKDTEGRYLGCNQFVANMAGFDRPEQIIGKTDFDLCWKEFASDWRIFDLKVMNENKTHKTEEIARLADGRLITEITIKSPLCNDKKEIVGIIGTSMDITEQKNLEQDLIAARKKAEEASHAKTEFLENMRHDIRTPLTGIIGFAEILKMESDKPQFKEYAENLVASSHALLDFLDEVLEAVRVSSGEIPKMKKKFNIKKTVYDLIELNRAKAAQKNLDLIINFDETIPPFLIGDKVRIHRIVLELITNALNFTDFGYVTLSVQLAKREERGIILKLIVEDSGIGIPKEKQQDIYLQFKRLTPSYQGIYKGAGLGLSVVKQFIDDVGGEIYVESEIRKGSRFTCILPLQEPLLDDELGIDGEWENTTDKCYETTFAKEVRPSPIEINTQKHRVLIVEDNLIAQTVAKSIVEKLNCEADIAETGKSAINFWKQKSYDLIFMDIGLPDLDGYEVTHLIRVQESVRTTHTPIIALTAHAGDENKKRCIDAGMNAVLSKPLSIMSCSDILDAFIPGKRQELQNPKQINGSLELPEEHGLMFDLSQFPLLDLEDGVKITGSQSILYETLGFMIQNSLPNDFKLMNEAHEELDWDKTQQLAHKIKGGAVYVGAMKMKMACQYFERYWKSGQHDLLEPLYLQVVSVIYETIKEINNWLQGHEFTLHKQ
ncbi:sensory histidine-kinase / response regulator [Legionella moravica]|uniref:histidine kinase n=1 Tax=Legionella moravica TaxID=39962 RepID=A0A378JWX6_9GAMM|nr:response regulator [Legionella moravica]KTD35427.1 sensory histidine-kinase / response regulator [Legionella moravica]STX62012.1 sensory histidine-kinase / response regulator [Legionella moravica]